MNWTYLFSFTTFHLLIQGIIVDYRIIAITVGTTYTIIGCENGRWFINGTYAAEFRFSNVDVETGSLRIRNIDMIFNSTTLHCVEPNAAPEDDRGRFILVLGVSDVYLLPKLSVVGLGRNTSMCCTAFSRESAIGWFINRTFRNTRETSVTPFGRDSILQLHNVPITYNNTRIECGVNNPTEGLLLSQPSYLLVQGLLSAVGSLEVTGSDNFTVFLNWTAPFTLDLPYITCDITYCVNVQNTTSSAALHSECGICTNEFTLHLLPHSRIGCDEYNFTVTPVNVVGNGTQQHTLYSWDQQSPDLEIVFWPTPDYIKFILTSPVCSAEVIFMDVVTGETIRPIFTIKFNNITIASHQLNENHHYNVTTIASNTAGLAMSQVRISTHEVRNITVEGGTIETEYFEHSNAAGALFIFLPLDTTPSERPVYLALGKNNSHHFMVPFKGRMEVLIFDIDREETLAKGVNYPAINTEMIITNLTQDLPVQQPYSLLDGCHIATTRYVIIAECAYFSDSNTTGFQLIARLCSNSSMIYVAQAVNQEPLASVLVEEIGLYQIAIFAIKGETGIVDTIAEHVEQLMVGDNLTTNTIKTLTTTAATEVPFDIPFLAEVIGIGCLGILGLLCTTFFVIVIVQCCRARKSRAINQPEEQQVQTVELDTRVSRLYEEIGDPPAATTATSTFKTFVSTRVTTSMPEYEDVAPPAKNTKYQITQCLAYGVPTK